MLVWQAHKGKIESLAFSPDGRLVATATGGTKFVYLWDATTGKLARKVSTDWPDGRTARVQAIAFAAAAPLLAAGTTRTAIVWDTNTWELVADLHLDFVYEVAFGGGESPVLAAANSSFVHVWTDPGRPTGDVIREPDRKISPPNGIPALDVSPDGTTIGLTSSYQSALWNAATGDRVRGLPRPHSNHRGAVRFSPDGSRLALARGKWVDVWDVAGGDEPALTFKADMSRSPAVWALGWADGGRVLLTAGTDGFARFWDATTATELRSFAWDIGKVFCAAFAPDGLTCAAGGANGQVVVWDVDA